MATAGSFPASATVRNPGGNPATFFHVGSDCNGDCIPDGVAAGPLIGENWISSVGLIGNEILSIVILAQTPSPGPVFLCTKWVGQSGSTAGVPHCFPFPADIGLIGTTLCSQGIGIAFAPTFTLQWRNALDLLVGAR